MASASGDACASVGLADGAVGRGGPCRPPGALGAARVGLGDAGDVAAGVAGEDASGEGQ